MDNSTAINDSDVLSAESQDPCAPDLVGDYDFNIHLTILFVIMIFSFLGTMLPVVGKKFKFLGKINDLPFQCGKMFGAGVILATAWVHMFSPADQILTNPCLPALFTETYTSWAGALALLAALSTHMIQFLASRAIRAQLGKGHQQIEKVAEVLVLPGKPAGGHIGGGNSEVVGVRKDSIDDSVAVSIQSRDKNHEDDSVDYLVTKNIEGNAETAADDLVRLEDVNSDGGSQQSQQQQQQQLQQQQHHQQQQQHNLCEQRSPPASITNCKDLTAVDISTSMTTSGSAVSPSHHTSHHKSHDHDHATADEHGHHLILLKEKHLTTYILEIGIATHSVIIGLTMGVARGSEVRSLAVALVFHQFFEGLALSTVVLESHFEKQFVAIGMVLFYTLTTPFGVALGIGLSEVYNGNGQSALLTQGILDSLSAGILAYDALVNIIFMHFSAPALRMQSDFAQFMQLGSLWLGAFIMA